MPYPDDFTEFREIENLPGITYDPENKRYLFAEDLQKIQAAIARIEQVLGLNPAGGLSSVGQSLDVLYPLVALPPIRASDSFLGPALNTAMWSSWAGANLSIGAGYLELTVNSNNYFGVDSLFSYDLKEKFCQIELYDLPNPVATQYEIEFQLRTSDNQNRLNFFISDGNISALKTVAGSSTIVASEAYNPSVHRWLRIGSRDGSIFWDTHPPIQGDLVPHPLSEDWSNLHSEIDPFNPVNLMVTLDAGRWAAAADYSVKFRRLNSWVAAG